MDRLYTCFVSSTFLDLQSERQRLVRTLLSNNCVPFGMEFFPSAGKTQWPIIVESIEHADFCIFVVAGRYGSISDEPPLSWTHREFREARRREKPIAAIVHTEPFTLPAERVEPETEGRRALADFREEIEKATVYKPYTDMADLVEAASASIRYLQTAGLLNGWVRADEPATSRASALEAQLTCRVLGAPAGDLQRLTSTVPRPWPFDRRLVVANELREARTEAEARRSQGTAPQLSIATHSKPSEHAVKRAWDTFEHALSQYGSDLEDWLRQYRKAATRRANTVELTLSITNAEGGTFAEDVMLEVRLPPGVAPARGADDPASVPPERPVYKPPTGSAFAGLDLPTFARSPIPYVPLDILSRFAPEPTRAQWNETNTVATIRLGSIHAGRTTQTKPIHLVAETSGEFSVEVITFSRSLRKPVETQLLVAILPDEPVPVFTNLNGILAYPDVDLVDADGEVVHAARTSDPPLVAPELEEADSGDREATLVRLRSIARRSRWESLGLRWAPIHCEPRESSEG